MSPAKTNSEDDPPSDDTLIELLRDTSLTAADRLDRLERELSGTDTDVFDALVLFATADQHVFLDPESEYQTFLDLCSEADISAEDVLRASLDDLDRVEILPDEIRSLPTLSDAEVEERVAMFETAMAARDRELLSQNGDPSADDGTDADGQSDDEDISSFVQDAQPVPAGAGQTMTAQMDTSTDGESDTVTTAPGSGHQSVDKPAQQTDPTESGTLSMPNYAQDLVDFEFVMEENEDYLPNNVSGSGIVVTAEDEYVGLLQIKPRSWSIHTDTKKSEIIDAYKSSFLATLDFPLQIVSYPTKFDISDHVSRLEEVADERSSSSDDTTLVNIGRNLYPNWLERFILDNDMKQRQFYIVVPLTADQLNEFQTGTDGFLDALADKAPPLEPLAEKFSSDSGQQEVSREQCVRELRSRLSRIESGLRRLDIGTERLTDRDEVMGVIYHYYNNEQPMNDAFPTGPYSVVDSSENKQ